MSSQNLLQSHPGIAAEADGWDPSKVTPDSGKKLSWKCIQGHKWEAVVGNRTKRNDTCPYCSGKKFLKGKTDLASLFPELAKQADGWDASTVSPGSNKKLSWKCQKGHVWEAVVANRAGKGYGCPICSGQQILSGFNDLATKFPDIAKEAFGWDPSVVAPYSNIKREWKCSQGHVWKSNVTNRTHRNDGCTICSSHQTKTGFNDLATTDPELAKEAFGWDPTSKSRSSNKKMRWRCELGHIYSAVIGARSSGSGCPICSGKKVETGFNDLATINPNLAAQADGWDPTKFTRASNKKLAWRCEYGHRWETTLSNRSKGKGCPVCSGQKVLIGFNDLETTHPSVAKEAYGWDPKSVVAGSTRKNLDWQCSKGHIWKSTVARRSAGSGCPVCAGQKAHAGFNDLATTHPDIAKEAFGWDPTQIMAGTDKKLSWRCPLGHIYNARGAERKNGNNCPVCSGQQVLAGFNDLATTHPWIAKQAIGWDPATVTFGTGKKLQWVCEFGHKWRASVGHRTAGSATGCPTCAKTGFDPNKNGWLYFLRHEDWEMLQIGITNVPDNRLSKHRKLGWSLLELRGPMDGQLTQEWETSILRFLRKNGARLSAEEVAGKFDGYSESWIEKSYPVSSLQELMEKVRDFEA